MKIAWFTPFSRKSAIGQYSAIIIQELSNSAEVTVYTTDLTDPSDAWLPNVDLRFINDFSRQTLLDDLNAFDQTIYNIGDYLPFHKDIYEVAMVYPGLVILHDLVVHHLIAGYYMHYKTDEAAYVRELEYAHGRDGRVLGEKVVNQQAGQIWDQPIMLDFHMAKSVLHGCYGVVVHSQFARRTIEQFATSPVTQINFPTPAILQKMVDRKRGLLPPTRNKIRLLTFGHINSNKKVADVIQAIARSSWLREYTVYHILGPLAPSYAEQVNAAINDNQLTEQVQLLGYQPDPVLYDYLDAADIVINLRNPHFGESSWSLLESTSIGKPTIVWKHGYYDEFPDEVIVKISNEQELRAALEKLSQSDAARRALGQRAAAYVRETFVTANYCRDLLSFVQNTLYHKPALDLADFVASLLLEMNADSVSAAPLVETFTQEIAHLLTN